MADDMIYRQKAIDALWKALFEYEDKTEEQFLESDKLDISEEGKPINDGRYWCEQHISFMYYCSDAERRLKNELPTDD